MLMLDPLSMTSVPLFPRFDQMTLGVATGFFYKFNGATYLVSNWHVMSGRHPSSGQPLDKNGAVPNSLGLYLHKTTVGHFRRDAELPLIDSQGAPLWRQHGTKGQDVDIAVLQVPNIDPMFEIKLYCVNEQDNESALAVRVGTDVFIVGFPKGLALQDILPI